MFVVHVRTSEKLNSMDNILLVAEARGENMALGTIRKRRNKTNLIRHIKFINVFYLIEQMNNVVTKARRIPAANSERTTSQDVACCFGVGCAEWTS